MPRALVAILMFFQLSTLGFSSPPRLKTRFLIHSILTTPTSLNTKIKHLFLIRSGLCHGSALALLKLSSQNYDHIKLLLKHPPYELAALTFHFQQLENSASYKRKMRCGQLEKFPHPQFTINIVLRKIKLHPNKTALDCVFSSFQTPVIVRRIYAPYRNWISTLKNYFKSKPPHTFVIFPRENAVFCSDIGLKEFQNLGDLIRFVHQKYHLAESLCLFETVL